MALKKLCTNLNVNDKFFLLAKMLYAQVYHLQTLWSNIKVVYLNMRDTTQYRKVSGNVILFAHLILMIYCVDKLWSWKKIKTRHIWLIFHYAESTNKYTLTKKYFIQSEKLCNIRHLLTGRVYLQYSLNIQFIKNIASIH